MTEFNFKKIRASVDNQEYTTGVEVIAFNDEGETVAELSIVDEQQLTELQSKLDNISKSFVSTTQQDINNVLLLNRKDRGELSESDPLITNMVWSDWHNNNLPLDVILKNEIPSTSTVQPYTINASQLNGKTSDEFSTVTHNHDSRYLQLDHEDTIAGYSNNGTIIKGHISKIVDDLNDATYINGHVLSSHQGNVLDNRLKIVEDKFKWGSWIKPANDSHIRYKVNIGLRLCNLVYHYNDYTGCKDQTGVHYLANNIIPSEYCPSANVTQSLPRGDITFHINKTGSLVLHNLTKVNSVDIGLQMMWKF